MASRDSRVGDAQNLGKRRRNRVPVSCFNCRTLKTKCDGGKPVCATCARHGRACGYAEQGISGNIASSMVTVSHEYLHALVQRLEALEKRSVATSSMSATWPQSTADETNSNESAQANHLWSTMRSCSISLKSQGETSMSVIADANVSMGGISFPQLILNAMHGKGNVKAQSMTTDKDVRDKNDLLSEEDLYTLPANASELLDQFFKLRHDLSPVFHVPSIRPMFDAALCCPPSERPYRVSSFILMNMIFAISTSHWMMNATANHYQARRHYDIAIALMQPNLLRDWSLEHVQALLLGARYLQGSSCADECWNVLGLAIRIAYGLRLHQDPPEADSYPMREMKRRVWCAAYTLDMLFSMIYERPSAIRSSECTVQLPEDLDDCCIQPTGLLYPVPKRPSSMIFSIEVVKLYRILESFLSSCSRNLENGRAIANFVLGLDEEHCNWYRALPAHLILDFNDVKEQALVLALRSNMVRILIHRPSLIVTLRSLARAAKKLEDSMIRNALQYSRNVCVTAAMDTIDIVALRHEQSKAATGPSWFNLYYLFNAVLILVSHVIDPAYSDDKATLAKVDMALHMIKAMSVNHAFAQRAYCFLQQVLGYMDRSITARREPNFAPADSSVSIAPAAQSLGTGSHGNLENVRDLYSLYGFTQNLTDNLEMRLENFENGDLTEWFWPSW